MSDTATRYDQTIVHEDLDVNDEDPYQSVRYLGHGASGSVDEVKKKGDTSQKCFARKQVVLQRGSQRNRMIEELRQEARTIQRLRHRHIIRLVGTYTRGKVFGIVMEPVAQADLQDFLYQVNVMEFGEKRKDACELLISWPGCLLRALDYLHEMRVKHRDIKPSNIVIKGRDVYFTDFGISRVIPEGYTTGTNGPSAMTRMYAAPETFNNGPRRGRAVDIFSLGCVFLEMAVVLWWFPEAREDSRRYCADITKSTNYAQNRQMILIQLLTIWVHYYNIFYHHHLPPPSPQWQKILIQRQYLSQLAFLMLDTNPETRITSRQLVGMISASGYGFHNINLLSCDNCRCPTTDVDTNLPLHSVFKDARDLNWNESIYNSFDATDWEAAKRELLTHHMWWEEIEDIRV